jgi:ATP-dependent DNA ligase
MSKSIGQPKDFISIPEPDGRALGSAYLDGEPCGVDDAGLPSFAHTQAATDGESGARLVYYAFDLRHIGGFNSMNTRPATARSF